MGLKINLTKSTILGIEVPSEQVSLLENHIGYGFMTTPFLYPSLVVGVMLNRLSNWKDVVGKVGARLSRWKVKTLSVGGRLALIKSVLGSTPTFFMLLFKAPMDVLQKIEAMNNNFFVGADLEEKKVTWISWKKVLSQKKYNGGLGVSSTFSLNHALLSKCVWWFCSNLDAL